MVQLFDCQFIIFFVAQKSGVARKIGIFFLHILFFFSFMNKKMVIELYEKKDRKRKRMLFELFSETILLSVSLSFISQLINRELGVENLISEDDVRYCRHYFKDKTSTAKGKAKLPDVPKPETLSSPVTKEVSWTNPDDVTLSKTVKSKFSKQ